MLQFICLIFLIFLDVLPVCQTFPSDVAERELFHFISRQRQGARGTGGCSSGVKWPELEADHSFTSCARVRIERGYAYIPTVCCHGVHRDDLNVT